MVEPRGFHRFIGCDIASSPGAIQANRLLKLIQNYPILLSQQLMIFFYLRLVLLLTLQWHQRSIILGLVGDCTLSGVLTLQSQDRLLQFIDMISLTVIVSVSWQLVSLSNHLKQHLLQLSETNPIIGLWFQHLPHYTLNVRISYFFDLFIKQLKIDGICVEVIKMFHVSQMNHMQEGDSQGEDPAFVGQCTHQTLLFEHLQGFRSIVEVFFLVEVEQVAAEGAAQDLADAFFIDYDVLRSKCVVQDLIFIEIRKHKDATAKDAHKLLFRKIPHFLHSTLNLAQNCMVLVLKVLSQSELLGAQVGLTDDLAIKCIEIKLMRNRVIHLMPFHVLIELLLSREGMLDNNHTFLRQSVAHKGFPLLQLPQKFIGFQLRSAG